MTEERIERRLAAILAADVVGYSRLMEANEEGTMSALKAHRRECFDPTVERHGGRIFKVMGDGFLVEFGSVLNAARCAVEIQRGMAGRNEGVPEDRHIRFRIGLNLGDLIVEGDDFYGDGVNLAARLEGLAGPGGIACSAVVRQQVGNRLDVGFLDQGARAVKNIAEPVHVYFIDLAEGGAGLRPAARADKPSVAVLPFANMSNDPEQEFFSDGITEDIITDLSKVSGLLVTSRNTVFSLKGRALNLSETARQLGVGYLVEGSVRKAGNRVRITAQLIEGVSDRHIWAERYDRDLTDIFAVQDEITEAIVGQLKVRLLPEEKSAIELAPTDNVEAYTNYLRGQEFYRVASKASLVLARQMFARAVELDPRYARAYVGIANCLSLLKSQHGGDFSAEDILATTEKALEIDPALAEAHAARGNAFSLDDRRDEAATAFERALTLDENCYDAHYGYGRLMMNSSDFERAAAHFTRAMEVQPEDYQAALFLSSALLNLGRKADVETYIQIGMKRAEEALRLHPENGRPAQLLAPALASIGQGDAARVWLARALEIDPEDNILRYNAACTYALLGEGDKALDLLEVWIVNTSQDARLWFRNDPDFTSIRGHARYQQLLEGAGLSG